MKGSLVSIAAAATLVAVVVSSFAARRSPVDLAPRAATEGARLRAATPVAFVPNLGQWQHGARFVARVGAMTVFLESTGWTFTLIEPPRPAP